MATRAEVIELAIATMPVKNRQEAEAIAWLLVNTSVVEVIDATLATWEAEIRPPRWGRGPGCLPFCNAGLHQADCPNLPGRKEPT